MELGNLLCLADRVETLLPRAPGERVDRDAILSKIRTGSGRMFNPWWVDALEEVTGTGFLEMVSEADAIDLRMTIPDENNPLLGGKDVSRLARLFSQVIDFRCRFTATHSRGVAATSMAIAHELHMRGDDRDALEVASELHDLGKLGVPNEIIMKPAALDERETATMQRHAEHGYNALSGAPGLEDVAELVGQHHERLDGTGYPNGLKGNRIGLASRVLAVSDVFTAMGEDRPYRAGIELHTIVETLQHMADNKALDPDVVSLVAARRHDLDELRRSAQAQALKDFDHFSGALAP
jgi:HD-GYP domain-containing protein (c-di-GMP phosphodiesterase class II)